MPACTIPQPNVTGPISGINPEADGRYDVFALGPTLKEPWFARMRGVLSQIFFKNNCNRIQLAQLSLLLLADKGEKINWGLILNEHFRVQLRGYRRDEAYSSPIGPFLTAYITRFLAYYRTNNQPPRIGSFLDLQRDMAMAAKRDPAAPSTSKHLRISEPTTAEGNSVTSEKPSRLSKLPKPKPSNPSRMPRKSANLSSWKHIRPSEISEIRWLHWSSSYQRHANKLKP